MFLANDGAALKVGELVSFDVTWTEGPLGHLEGVGTVVWKRTSSEVKLPPGCGVAFDYIAPTVIPAWLDFIRASKAVAVIPSGSLADQERIAE